MPTAQQHKPPGACADVLLLLMYDSHWSVCNNIRNLHEKNVLHASTLSKFSSLCVSIAADMGVSATQNCSSSTAVAYWLWQIFIDTLYIALFTRYTLTSLQT